MVADLAIRNPGAAVYTDRISLSPVGAGRNSCRVVDRGPDPDQTASTVDDRNSLSGSGNIHFSAVDRFRKIVLFISSLKTWSLGPVEDPAPSVRDNQLCL